MLVAPLALLMILSATGCTDVRAKTEPTGVAAPRPAAGEQTAAADPPPAPASKPADDAIAVTVYTAHVASIQPSVTLNGELRADESLTLQTEIAGRIAALPLREGQPVRAGDLLVKLDDTILQAERERVVARRDLAAVRADRAAELFARSTISADQNDEAAADLAALEAEFALIEARIAQTEIRAPFDGVIGLRAVSPGSYVTPTTPIASLVQLDPIELDIDVPERHVDQLRRGARVDFRSGPSAETVDAGDATDEDAHVGTITAIEPRIDPETRTVRVRAEARNPGGRLLPGAFARIELPLGEARDALLVPAIALQTGLEGATLFVVEDGQAALRRVRTGIRTRARVAIVDGLAAGEQVVIEGRQRLRPGAAVVVTEDRAASAD
ncbi:MAG: efflux RND transporter periplasmic adaptor subunit [Acidobacteriota bacterium]